MKKDRLRVVTARYGETWEALALRCSISREELMRLNRYWGDLLPGMRLTAPRTKD